MKTLTASEFKRAHHSNNLFSLFIEYDEVSTKMTMQIYGQIVNTEHIPSTYSMLEKYLPSILRSECFNNKEYPFKKEVKKTEIGHLFEHILLEYLSNLKRELGFEDSIHNGVTEWKLKEESKGIFYISIDAGYKDRDIFEPALYKSIQLLRDLFQTIPFEYASVQSASSIACAEIN